MKIKQLFCCHHSLGSENKFLLRSLRSTIKKELIFGLIILFSSLLVFHKASAASSGLTQGQSCTSSAQCSGNDNYCIAVYHGMYTEISDVPAGTSASAWCMPSSVLTEQSTSNNGSEGSECSDASQCTGADDDCIAVVSGKYVEVNQAPAGSVGYCMPTSVLVEQASQDTGETTTTFANPLGFDTIQGGLTLLINNLQGIVATIAIIFIIIGGIMYMLSAGDETMIKRAKATWTGAVIGLAIIFAAPAFLKEIGVILGINQTNSAVAGALSLQQIALNILGFLFSIVGIIAIISMIIGGVIYLTAYGDEKRIDTAKKILTSSILGVVIVFAALIIVNQIRTLLGG